MNFDLPVRCLPDLFLWPCELPGFSNGGWTPAWIRLLNVFAASVVAFFPLSLSGIRGIPDRFISVAPIWEFWDFLITDIFASNLPIY